MDQRPFRGVARPVSEARSKGWRFAGRERELAAIVQGVRGGAAAVVLAGPAGVGKSRLAARGLAELGRTGGPPTRCGAPHRHVTHRTERWPTCCQR